MMGQLKKLYLCFYVKLNAAFVLITMIAVLALPTVPVAANASQYESTVYSLDSLPLGLDKATYFVPEDNPLTAEKIELGRLLFFDKRLSVDDTVACASCHSPSNAFSDGRSVSLGVNDAQGGRNAPTILNRFANTPQFWDGRAASLEEQATGPMINPLEMAMPNLQAVTDKIAGIKGYRARFKKIFGSKVNIDDIARAIAAFERTIASGNSRWDKYEAGDKSALSLAEQRGLDIFNGKGRCNQCHTGWNLTNERYINTGIGWDKANVDLGRYVVTKKEKNIGAFKTPTLRDVALTWPYMHDGSKRNLAEVIDYYNEGVILNPFLDVEFLKPIDFMLETLESNGFERSVISDKSSTKKLNFTEQEKTDLLAFLMALSGEGWEKIKPPVSFPM